MYFTSSQFVWIDDDYMGTSLNNELSRLTGNPEHVLESMEQHFLFHGHLSDKMNDGIYFHGFNGFTRQNSCCKWGRGRLKSMLSFNKSRGKLGKVLGLGPVGENGPAKTEKVLAKHKMKVRNPHKILLSNLKKCQWPSRTLTSPAHMGLPSSHGRSNSRFSSYQD